MCGFCSNLIFMHRQKRTCFVSSMDIVMLVASNYRRRSCSQRHSNSSRAAKCSVQEACHETLCKSSRSRKADGIGSASQQTRLTRQSRGVCTTGFRRFNACNCGAHIQALHHDCMTCMHSSDQNASFQRVRRNAAFRFAQHCPH